MKFSENWLREWVDPGVDRETLCRRLDMIGLEVESVAELGAGLDHVVVAQIVSAERHPEADRLQVCQVDTGHGSVQIVCGAPNARAGLKAPLAQIGAALPNGMAIKAARLRGVESQGMLCSARELGLDQDATGLMELPDDAPVGTPLARYLALPDASIELGLTPNRADCLGLRGVAYDVAASFGRQVAMPAIEPVAAAHDSQRGVRLDAPAQCPRYCGRVVSGIDARARTPVWMAERLRRGGIRPISIAVDITAYVMLELGQPMHAFDQARLQGDIHVRAARAGEKITLLDGREVEVDEGFLVVADDGGAVALAGIMGGLDSRVTDDTVDVFLESAHFVPSAITGRARRLGMHTDASHRFERGVDPELPRLAIERATALLTAIAGGQPGPVVEAVSASHLPNRAPVALRRARIGRLLGVEVADADVERVLSTLGMSVAADGDGWLVTPPSWRFDIAIEEDLIEEVARIHGYDRIPTRAPAGELAPALPGEGRLADSRLRSTLAARGWLEALTFAFVDGTLLDRWLLSGPRVELANPLSAELAVMRPSLLPGLVQALAYNRARQQDRVRLFELGRSFHQKTDNFSGEIDQLALVMAGPADAEQWGAARRPADFHDLKGDLEALIALGGDGRRWQFEPAADVPWLHPGRSARVLRDGVVVGFAGALHPAVQKALDLGSDPVHVAEIELDALRQARVPAATGLSRFPQVRRDIAVLVSDAVAYSALQGAVREAVGELLEDLVVFDEYRGKGLPDGLKSIAMGLILRNPSRTLTDEDADQAVASAVQALNKAFQAELRG
ncbi:phenylalanine--tRNA ligase subunit beta [Pseudofulvimonas gallinarii]|uniref:Phenylalanine--tRNA ligase beta subunit n=1 Tax=Pseudofulvimonas gallinarii TaxID=634155 RepID=A0A4S3KVF7_9GAMM|nr:phenylalanine--tRNA ligase subunit beta [Pseudofulvimonas gallinarii]TCS97375.1 phenylalanyl-tRNA synthetase beta subunit [Pseudofulvimonas gallinarii]THD13207.1 phenylalanine--tRNA ligase subunit beta [Pseudofulvimonas gallinarii]